MSVVLRLFERCLRLLSVALRIVLSVALSVVLRLF